MGGKPFPLGLAWERLRGEVGLRLRLEVADVVEGHAGVHFEHLGLLGHVHLGLLVGERDAPLHSHAAVVAHVNVHLRSHESLVTVEARSHVRVEWSDIWHLGRWLEVWGLHLS